jgi:hypothetical protein
MNTRLAGLALLLLVAGCGAQPTPERAPSANARMTVLPLALEPPPVYALIGYRERLELSSQQVTALDSIATTVRVANSPLIDSLQAKAITNNRTPGVLQINPSERPLLQQIRDNTRRAIDEVAGVLTSEQLEEVCELYEPEREEAEDEEEERANRRQSPEDAFRRGLPFREDSSLTVRGFTVWPWCQRGGAPADTVRAGS